MIEAQLDAVINAGATVGAGQAIAEIDRQAARLPNPVHPLPIFFSVVLPCHAPKRCMPRARMLDNCSSEKLNDFVGG